MTDHKKKNGHAHPQPDPHELRRLNMARFGSTMTPRNVPVDQGALDIALSMIASAGLPDPIITTETVSPPEGGLDYTIDVYTFLHIRVAGLAFRATVTDVYLFPLRVIQICKSAGIRTDALPITDDPPIEGALAAPPPPVV